MWEEYYDCVVKDKCGLIAFDSAFLPISFITYALRIRDEDAIVTNSRIRHHK